MFNRLVRDSVKTFQAVIDELGPALGRIAASYERNAALREELLQDIFLAVFRSLPRLKEQAKLKTYAFRIAHNCCVDHVVRHAALPRTQDAQEELPGDGFTPEQILLGQEKSYRLLQAVRRLEMPYRQVMTLLLEDMSYVEIGESLGISVANVGVRVNRAKTLLKELLHDDG
jgi:RNA polymerase sigma factor (sigma-70 family)